MQSSKITRTALTEDGKLRLTNNNQRSQSNHSELDRYLNNGKRVETTAAQASDLDAYYRAAQKQLDAGKRAAQQDAAVAMETLNKYLPIQNKMNGMSGLGVSESSAIDIYNKYISNLGTIEQNHAADSASLLKNYVTAKKEEEALAKAERDSVFQEYMTMLESGLYNGTEDIDRYLENARGRVSDDQYAQLDAYANYIKNNPIQKEMFAQNAFQNENTSLKQNGVSFYENDDGDYGLDTGDDFTLVDDNGKTYSIESRGAVSDSALASAAANVANNSIFAYGGKIYYKINGTLYEVGGRKGSNTTDDYTELYNRFYGDQTKPTNAPNGFVTFPAVADKTKPKEQNYSNRMKKVLGK